MLVRDLTLAGCVEAVRQLPRPELPGQLMNATGDQIHSDGTLTVVHLKDCDPPHIEYSRKNPLVPVRPRSRVARYLRTQILLYKSDVIRGNFIYCGYDLARLSFRRLRHHHRANDEEDGLPLFPVSPETLFPHSSLSDVSLGP